MPHAKAWKAEKARRRSAIHRKQGVQDRAKVHFKMTESWTKHFWEGDPEQPEDRQDIQWEAESDLPTVVIDKRGNEVAPASSKVYLRPLTRKEKTYYREEGPTELKPSVVPAVYAKKANRSEEARKEANRKRAARRKRLAGKGKWKSNVKKHHSDPGKKRTKSQMTPPGENGRTLIRTPIGILRTREIGGKTTLEVQVEGLQWLQCAPWLPPRMFHLREEESRSTSTRELQSQ